VSDAANSKLVAFDYFGNEISSMSTPNTIISAAFKPGVYAPLSVVLKPEEMTTVETIEFEIELRDRFGGSIEEEEAVPFELTAYGEIAVSDELSLSHSLDGEVRWEGGRLMANVSISYIGNWTFELVEKLGLDKSQLVGGESWTTEVKPGPTHATSCRVEYDQNMEAGGVFKAVVETFDRHGNPTLWDEDQFEVVIDGGNRTAIEGGRFERPFNKSGTYIFDVELVGDAEGGDAGLVGGAQSVLKVKWGNVSFERSEHSLMGVPQWQSSDFKDVEMSLDMVVYDKWGNIIAELETEEKFWVEVEGEQFVLAAPRYSHKYTIEKGAQKEGLEIIFKYMKYTKDMKNVSLANSWTTTVDIIGGLEFTEQDLYTVLGAGESSGASARNVHCLSRSFMLVV